MLQSLPLGSIPDATLSVAKAAIPASNTYITLRDQIGTIFDDSLFAPLFSVRGQPAAMPWRLALVTIMQFAEGFSDRDAAEPVRTRIDWKYLAIWRKPLCRPPQRRGQPSRAGDLAFGDGGGVGFLRLLPGGSNDAARFLERFDDAGLADAAGVDPN
jgi:hypothetical protein